MKALTQLLKSQSYIKTLNLSGINLDHQNLKLLSETLKVASITDLNISGIAHIEDQSIGEALKCNTSLTTLNVSGHKACMIDIKMISEGLKTNSSLGTLILQSNQIGSRGARIISDLLKTNRTLRKISLCYNYITITGVKYIELSLNSNTTLTSLILKRNPSLSQYHSKHSVIQTRDSPRKK